MRTVAGAQSGPLDLDQCLLADGHGEHAEPFGSVEQWQPDADAQIAASRDIADPVAVVDR